MAIKMKRQDNPKKTADTGGLFFMENKERGRLERLKKEKEGDFICVFVWNPIY